MKPKRKSKSRKIPTCATCAHETRSGLGNHCLREVKGRYYFQTGKSRCGQYEPEPAKETK